MRPRFVRMAEFFTSLLDNLPFGHTVSVFFLPKTAGVQIPAHLLTNEPQMFSYSREPSYGIPDLTVSEKGISATLRFRGQHMPTVVPWAAVVYMEVPERTGQIAFEKKAKKVSGLRAVRDDENPPADFVQVVPTKPGLLRVVR